MYAPIQFINHRLLHPQLSYREISPSKALQPFVACYWFLNSVTPLYEVVPHRVLPDGCVDILVDFTSGEAHFVGVMSEADIVPLISIVQLMGIRFLPHSLPLLLKGEAGFVANSMLGLTEVWGSEAGFIEELSASGLMAEQRVKVIERALLSWFGQDHVDPKWSGLLNLISERKGRITIAELADYYTVSERHISRTFKSVMGITAKEYTNIIRFQGVLQYLKQSGSTVDWADLSLNSGYYDQSHFIHEFKKRYGITPGRLIAGECPIFPIQSPPSPI
ncbi:Bifunctional transcriptional activator/DNA repair enzyme AdaA [compost metagenome]